MRIIKFLWIWARRLPSRFFFPFLAIMLAYLEGVAAVTKEFGAHSIAGLLLHVLYILGAPKWLGSIAFIKIFFEGLAITALLLAGVLLAYNLSARIYRGIRRQPTIEMPKPIAAVEGQGTRLNAFERIGVVLAGGGAKGAYQAGAMKAIYEFLEENGALSKVKMISGTSIGSWNSLFWLAGLIKAGQPGAMSTHERWWREICLDRIMEFDYYLPLRGNHFVLATPWKDVARKIFLDAPDVRQEMESLFVPVPAAQPDPMHFYFTRSNVEQGRLEFCTNWPGIGELKDSNNRPLVRCGRYEVIAGDPVDSIQRTLRGVFASMDIPPLFPYMKVKRDRGEWFEDGGVIDNLPIWFGTQVEACDLLFVLPLNATFAEPINTTSVVKRLSRVLSVRQGVLERNSLKLAYLYNELAAVRNASDHEQEEGKYTPDPKAVLSKRALGRKHKPVSIFAICPESPLAIDTTEFWKPTEAGDAFDLMYAATKCELQDRFEKDIDPAWIRMTRVSPQGERSYVDDF